MVKLNLAPGWRTLGEGVAIGIGTVVSFSLVTFIHIVLGEQAPKTFAIRNPERAALMSARIIDAFTRIFRPVIWLLDGATTLVLRLFGVAGASGHHSVYSADELKMLVHESQAEGVLEQTQERCWSACSSLANAMSVRR